MKAVGPALLVTLALATSASAAPSSRIAFAADRAPTSYGEIYRLDADGTLRNLSRSPAVDQFPAASPDGKHVAFIRMRAHSSQVVVVGSDGRGLHAVGPVLSGGGLRDGVWSAISWAPDGRHLAVVLTVGGYHGALFVATTDGGWKRIGSGAGQSPPSWSADSSRLAFTTTSALVHVVAADGRRLWNASGEGQSAFSRSGYLAVHENSETIGIYDASGRERKTFAGDAFAWSGDRLASLDNGLLVVRPNALAAPTLHARVTSKSADNSDSILWAGTNVVRVRGSGLIWKGYDVHRRRLLHGTRPFDTVWSATGVSAHTKFGSPLAWLVRGNKVVRTTLACNSDDPFESVQFLGRTNALVYQSGCATPSEDIYTVAPDGTALARVTRTATDEFSPALSPDGTRIAYSEQPIATFCKGCPHDLFVTPGGQLTNNDYSGAAPFDDSPSFSPDGTQIAFLRSGPDSAPTLYTLPTAGGTPTKLVPASAATWGSPGIAFVKGFDPASIDLLDPATGAVRTLATVKGQVDVQHLTWSPDGRLAYLRTDDAGRSSIVVVGGRTIALRQSRVSGLAWSPDGTRFAFVGDDANGWGEVFTIGADGSGVRQVTHDLNVQGNLSWR